MRAGRNNDWQLLNLDWFGGILLEINILKCLDGGLILDPLRLSLDNWLWPVALGPINGVNAFIHLNV